MTKSEPVMRDINRSNYLLEASIYRTQCGKPISNGHSNNESFTNSALTPQNFSLIYIDLKNDPGDQKIPGIRGKFSSLNEYTSETHVILILLCFVSCW